MSIFSNIMNRIFHRDGDQTASASATTTETPVSAAPASVGVAETAAPAPIAVVDVEKILNEMAAKNGQKLNWRTSIVDLLKLLDMDSSLAARKELATELTYNGALDGSAEMNTWLIRQVMGHLAANGGKVPAELRD